MIFLTIACILLNIHVAFAESVQTLPLFGLEVSCAENVGSYSPNSSGVYPVRLRWQMPEQNSPAANQNAGFGVYRSVETETGFELLSPEPIVKETEGFFIFIDENKGAVPGKPYYYRVSLLDSKGESAGFSETVMGYGALSPESYFHEYLKTVESSYQKLTYMNKKGALSKLGSEKIRGSISGSLSYQAKVAGLGGRVFMQYIDYADFYIDDNSALGPYFVLTGNSNTKASMTQNGTMDGTITISGMYPGQIYYDNIQIKDGAAGGGSYGVEPKGFPRSEVSWTFGIR